MIYKIRLLQSCQNGESSTILESTKWFNTVIVISLSKIFAVCQYWLVPGTDSRVTLQTKLYISI